jgi:hypothetical protein
VAAEAPRLWTFQNANSRLEASALQAVISELVLDGNRRENGYWRQVVAIEDGIGTERDYRQTRDLRSLRASAAKGGGQVRGVRPTEK